jgi:hypothetical protein
MVNLIKPEFSSDFNEFLGTAEFYTIQETGESGMSQTALAALCGVSQQSISNLLRFTLTSSAPSQWLEPLVGEDLTLTSYQSNPDLTVNNKKPGNLIVYRAEVCRRVIQHYAFVNRSQTAQSVLDTFLDIGINTWIQKLTGWDQKRDSLQPHTDVYIKRIEHMRDHKVDFNYWTIFREASELLLLLEKDWIVPVNDYDILDGSIGRHWSVYRQDKSWLQESATYTHCYRDQRGEVECLAYSYNELPYFRWWLEEVYKPEHLPKYLLGKYGKKATRLIYEEQGLLTPEIEEATEVKRATPKQEVLYQNFLLARQNLRAISSYK